MDESEHHSPAPAPAPGPARFERICFRASDAPAARAALARFTAIYGDCKAAEADVIVAIGGDGMMLETLAASEALDVPVYGMHRGTVGFLMNDYRLEGLRERLAEAEPARINPLRMTAYRMDGEVRRARAINEVSLIRQRHQAARIRILIDGKERMSELVCDGVMVATPAGSTAYNYSAHGPILPIQADILALTPISAFRPRRWRGALLPRDAQVTLEVSAPEHRPVSATADNVEVRDVRRVDVEIEREVTHTLLFDPGHGLEERLIREQFA
ncbi:NAD kinase [Rhodovulum sp. DZ06]|uniref:NAD kinase n=1 Tax=Rhodovulum sp. DZ06 TaxID=3425126 RepID=UPI003D3265FE